MGHELKPDQTRERTVYSRHLLPDHLLPGSQSKARASFRSMNPCSHLCEQVLTTVCCNLRPMNIVRTISDRETVVAVDYIVIGEC